MTRAVVRDMIAYLPARVVPAAVALLTVPLYTRFLTVEDYGRYLLVLTTLTLIGSFSFTWLTSVTLRFHMTTTMRHLIATVLPVFAAATLFAVLAWVGAVWLLGARVRQPDYVVFGIVWLVTFGAFDYATGWLRAHERAVAYSVAMVWRSLAAAVVALVVLAYYTQDAVVIIAAAAIVSAAALPVLGAVLWRDAAAAQAPIDAARPPGLRPLLRYGLPAALSNLTITALSLSDRFIINAYLGAEAVAKYGASYDLAEKSVFFVNAMLLLSSSVIGFRIFERDGAAAANVFVTKLQRIYLVACVLVVTILCAFAREIVEIMLPPAYADGYLVLPIVAVAGLFVGVMHRYSLILSFHHRTDLILLCSVLALALGIACCAMLTPIFTLPGAAAASVLGYGAWLFFIRVAAGRYSVPVFPWRTLARVLLAALFAALIMRVLIDVWPYAIELGILVGVATGGIVYGAVLMANGEVSGAEVKAAAAMLGYRTRNA